MPYRKSPIITGEIYHVFNRSIAKQPIFRGQKDYERAIEVINFYRYSKPPTRFSHFKRLPQNQKELILKNLAEKGELIIEILAFCLMPNHFHFLLKPAEDKAISTFLRIFQNSYSKYFNTKYERTGALFQSMFKATRIESDEQLLHVSRYIHLNPISSFIIKTEELENYTWSSFQDYINENQEKTLCDTKIILNYFKSRKNYKKFVYDQADYQKKLEVIKHIILE